MTYKTSIYLALKDFVKGCPDDADLLPSERKTLSSGGGIEFECEVILPDTVNECDAISFDLDSETTILAPASKVWQFSFGGWKLECEYVFFDSCDSLVKISEKMNQSRSFLNIYRDEQYDKSLSFVPVHASIIRSDGTVIT